MVIKQEKQLNIDDAKNAYVVRRQDLVQMEGALTKKDYWNAFRLFYGSIVKILCGEGIMEACSPYYMLKGKIEEKKSLFKFHFARPFILTLSMIKQQEDNNFVKNEIKGTYG